MMTDSADILCRDPECSRTLMDYVASLEDLPAGVRAVIAEAEEAGRIPPCDAAIMLGSPKTMPAAAHHSLTLSLPFHLSALGARLREAMAQAQREICLSDSVTLLESKRQLIHRSKRESIALTEKETGLLALLASGESWSRETLMERIWGYQDGLATHTVESHIWRLKKKVEQFTEHDPAPLTIVGEHGGYRLAGAV